jgi:hypothetical protein
MDQLTNYINDRNVQNIRYQINNKVGSKPYYGTQQNNRNAITDYDMFPYDRWFRGNFEVDYPIVAEREAGWRPMNENCYEKIYHRDDKSKNHDINPKHFFQPPCSVVYPKYVNKNDISFNDVKLNENCVISYR